MKFIHSATLFASLSLAALFTLCQPPAGAFAQPPDTFTVPTGYSLICNQRNNPNGNNIYYVLYNSVAVPDDNFSSSGLNAFFYTPYDNVNYTWLSTIFYENDFTPDNGFSLCSPAEETTSGLQGGTPVCSSAVTPAPPATDYLDGYATDASGNTCACSLPMMVPGQGGFINNSMGPVTITLYGAALNSQTLHHDLLPPPNHWVVASCQQILNGATFNNIFNTAPPLGYYSYVTLWSTSLQRWVYYRYVRAAPGKTGVGVNNKWQTSTGNGVWNNINNSAQPKLAIGEACMVMLKADPPFAVLSAAPASCSAANTILVTFNDFVSPVGADASNYTVTGPGSVNVPVVSVTAPQALVPASQLVLLTLGSSMASGATYTVSVNGVIDFDGDYSVTNDIVSLVNSAAPQLVQAVNAADNAHVTLTFDRPMDPISSSTAANYALSLAGSNAPAVIDATPQGPTAPPAVYGDTVLLTLSAPLSLNASYTVTVTNVNSACGTSVSAGASASFVDTVASPTLSADLDGANLSLFWPATNFVLQETTDLGSPASWVNSSYPFTNYNDTVATEIPLDSPAKFFRVVLQQ